MCGSDSGRIVILQYSKDKACFVRMHQETYGKSGCRRIVPGQHLAVDPKGRACMVGAVEKSKFVYVLNRDNEARLTISSPLEAHKGATLCYGLTGLDMGFDNPVFAAIELDYSEADQVRGGGTGGGGPGGRWSCGRAVQCGRGAAGGFQLQVAAAPARPPAHAISPCAAATATFCCRTPPERRRPRRKRC